MSLIQHVEGGKWFDHDFNEVATEAKPKLENESLLKRMEEKAEELLSADIERYNNSSRSKNLSNMKWYDEVARAGTFADRMSVVQVRVEQSPVHSLVHVMKVVESIHKKGLRESHSTLAMLKDLFAGSLLPNRKLLFFKDRPLKQYTKILSNAKASKDNSLERRLILWKFESNLKQCYAEFLRSLENIAGSAVAGVALNACTTMFNLLCDRPEGENFLLPALVNKFGHPLRNVASKVTLLLQKLLQKHFAMRQVVVGEVRQLIFRKNVSPKAQYFAIHYLSRIMLRAGEFDLALTLIKIYLNLFKIIIKKCADSDDHTILPLLITGVNRAFPYARSLLWSGQGELAMELDNLYTLVQNTKLSVSLNVLKLLFHIHNATEGLPDRFYASFYRRMLSISSSALNSQFFAFYLKVVKNDGVEQRVRAFLKRLFQLALVAPPEFAASALLIVEMIVKERPQLLRLEKEAEIEDTTKEAMFNDSSDAIRPNAYDPIARNPLFANADRTIDVELLALAEHYHPSVAIFAQQLIVGEPISYDGDPLENFNTMSFLDRFAHKNPKKRKQKGRKDGGKVADENGDGSEKKLKVEDDGDSDEEIYD